THTMPLSAPGPDAKNPARTIRKVADGSLSTNEGQEGRQIDKLPQAAPVHVDVTGKDAPGAAIKQAQLYALPSFKRYPLDNYAQVKAASAYFDEWGNRMDPALRREYCQNLVKRASQLGIELSKEARHYGASGYGDDAHVEAALEMRRSVIKEAEFQ